MFQGTALFGGGVILVLIGWTWLGFLVETYGFWLLFKGFIPTALTFFRRVPILGKILDLPVLKSVKHVFFLIEDFELFLDHQSSSTETNTACLVDLSLVQSIL